MSFQVNNRNWSAWLSHQNYLSWGTFILKSMSLYTLRYSHVQNDLAIEEILSNKKLDDITIQVTVFRMLCLFEGRGLGATP